VNLRGLYVITDRGLSHGRSDEEVVAAALRGGARVVQLRDKESPRPELIRIGRRLSELCREAGALFIVNDDPHLAAEVGADGVHLGPDDMAPDEARAILGPRAIIGWSVKASVDAAQRAQDLGVSYVAVGSIFPTTTKVGAREVGLDAIRQVRTEVSLPIAAIGGISARNLGGVIDAGADMACVISAAVAAPDVQLACSELARILEERWERPSS
jgi:thiamine-phosphate diphosphorylase